MKRTITAIILLLCCASLQAQLSQADYKAKYERQIKAVGLSGVGVETILNGWEEAFPDDPDMLMGRFNYLFQKSQRSEVVPKDGRRYLGKAPVVTLKNEKGEDVNYFEDIIFDQTAYSECQWVLDKAIEKFPGEIVFRFAKVNALISYEKDSPQMALQEINSLLDDNSGIAGDGGWTFYDKPFSQEEFVRAIQEYCATFYTIGSKVSYESFCSLSTRMNKLYPKNTYFLDNLGSYWLVVENNPKKAIKFYDKALKADPEDSIAKANRKIAERKIAASKKK